MNDKNETAQDIIVKLRDGDRLTDDERQNLWSKLNKLCRDELRVISYCGRFEFSADWEFEDLFQEIMEKLYDGGYKKFDETKGQFSTWFSVVSTNTYYTNYNKKKKRPNTIPVFYEGEEGEVLNRVDSICHEMSAEDELGKEHNRAKLYEMIGGLKSNYRDALLLCDIKGYKPREAARILGCSPHDISNWRGRACDNLRKAIAGEPAELEESLIRDLVA